MAMLPRVLTLGNVRDVEQLCRAVLDRFLRTNSLTWERTDYDDALADLLEETWRIWRCDYDTSRGLEFASYASFRLRGFCIDRFQRSRFGRVGPNGPSEEHEVRRAVIGAASLEQLAEELGLDRLEQAFASWAGDPAFAWRDAGVGVGAGRDREALREALAAVAREASTPKGVSKLLAELREEVAAIAGGFESEADLVVAVGEGLFGRGLTENEPVTA